MGVTCAYEPLTKKDYLETPSLLQVPWAHFQFAAQLCQRATSLTALPALSYYIHSCCYFIVLHQHRLYDTDGFGLRFGGPHPYFAAGALTPWMSSLFQLSPGVHQTTARDGDGGGGGLVPLDASQAITVRSFVTAMLTKRADVTTTVVGINLKKTLKRLLRLGIEVSVPLFDLPTAAWALDPNRTVPKHHDEVGPSGSDVQRACPSVVFLTIPWKIVLLCLRGHSHLWNSTRC